MHTHIYTHTDNIHKQLSSINSVYSSGCYTANSSTAPVQGKGQTTKLQCGSLEFGKRALGVSALVSAPQCMWPYTLAHTLAPHSGPQWMWPHCGPTVWLTVDVALRPGIGPTLSSGGGACESGRDTGTIGIKLSSSHWHCRDLHFHSFSPILPFPPHFSFYLFISHPQT